MIFALPFLASTWIFFDMGETVVVLYMVIYVVLGGATMLICMVFRKRRGDRINFGESNKTKASGLSSV